MKDVALVAALIDDFDLDPGVEESQLAQTGRQGLERKLVGFENLVIGPEQDPGPAEFGFAIFFQLVYGNAAFVILPVNFTVTANLEFKPLGKCVDHGNADAVQATGDLVGVTVKLAAGVQNGHDHLGSRFLLG